MQFASWWARFIAELKMKMKMNHSAIQTGLGVSRSQNLVPKNKASKAFNYISVIISSAVSTSHSLYPAKARDPAFAATQRINRCIMNNSSFVQGAYSREHPSCYITKGGLRSVQGTRMICRSLLVSRAILHRSTSFTFISLSRSHSTRITPTTTAVANQFSY